jgi:hypothetical protein
MHGVSAPRVLAASVRVRRSETLPSSSRRLVEASTRGQDTADHMPRVAPTPTRIALYLRTELPRYEPAAACNKEARDAQAHSEPLVHTVPRSAKPDWGNAESMLIIRTQVMMYKIRHACMRHAYRNQAMAQVQTRQMDFFLVMYSTSMYVQYIQANQSRPLRGRERKKGAYDAPRPRQVHGTARSNGWAADGRQSRWLAGSACDDPGGCDVDAHWLGLLAFLLLFRHVLKPASVGKGRDAGWQMRRE